MATERMLADAEAFAASYNGPSEGEHPDLESRVIMYRRAVKGGERRVIAAHARTLTRFARNVGAIEAGTSPSRDAEAGPTKADLQAEAESLGLSKSGSKAQLQQRIAEHRAAAGEGE